MMRWTKRLNAKKFCFYASALWLSLLSACALTPSSFNEQNIDKLRIGMPASEVREMFGAPNEVNTAVCGGATASGSWVCETWKYKTNTYTTNNFVFSVQQNTKLLNSWDVKRLAR